MNEQINEIYEVAREKDISLFGALTLINKSVKESGFKYETKNVNLGASGYKTLYIVK